MSYDWLYTPRRARAGRSRGRDSLGDPSYYSTLRPPKAGLLMSIFSHGAAPPPRAQRAQGASGRLSCRQEGLGYGEGRREPGKAEGRSKCGAGCGWVAGS